MKLRRNFIISVIILSLIVSGMALGGCNKEQSKTPAATTKEESKKVAELIAVVNEDTGVEFPSGTVNYSDEFIKTLDEELFTITSATAAEEGLKDGTYAGSLMFPANLSYMILNINYGNPQKIKLNYLISDIADKDISDKTHKRIIESYQDFNDRLSYAYINALLEEVEQGQNDVGKIFGNDASIIAAAEKFSDGDYDSEYKEPVLQRNTLDYSEHNTDEFRESGVLYADDVGGLYEKAYTHAYEETSVMGNIPDVEDVEKAAKAMKDKFEIVQQYNTELEEFTKDSLNPYKLDIEDYVKAVNDYMSAVALYEEAVSQYKDNAVPEYIQIVESRMDSLAEDDINAIKAAGLSLKEKGEGIIFNQTITIPNWGQNLVDNWPSFSPKKPLPDESEFNDVLDDFNTKTGDLYKNMNSLVNNLAPENMLNKAMNTGEDSQTYKQKISEKKSKFTTKASDTTKEFNKIQSGNIEKLTDSYEKNNKYMAETVEALNNKSEKDQETLKKAIGDFLKTAKGNSADTKKRLESFRSMLEKAKIEGRISSAVVEFLIQPIQLEEYNVN